MKIEARLTKGSFRHDQDNDGHLVVTLTAPDSAVTRPHICVVPVVDVSGSMGGSKLDYAKRSVQKLIEHLSPQDHVGLVVFGTDAHVIIPPTAVTDASKATMRKEVGDLFASGGTNLAAGMIKALEQIHHLDLPEGTILRVIVFTDGQANQGIATKPDELIKLMQANRRSVTFSAFGYGEGTDLDQTFLAALAKEGEGNFAHVRDPDSALEAFGKELGGLLSTYATNIVLDLSPLNGHRIIEVVSDVDADESDIGGEVVIKVPDLLTQEVRNIVLSVKLKSQSNAFPRQVNAFDLKAKFTRLAADGKTQTSDEEIKVKTRFVKAGEEQKDPDKDLDALVAMAQVVKAQIAAEGHARNGNFAEAQNVMHLIGEEVNARGHVGVGQVTNNIRRRLRSNTDYAANQGYLRTMSAGITRGMGVATYACDAIEDLQMMSVSLNNSAQESLVQAFTSDPGDGVGTPSVSLDSVAYPAPGGTALPQPLTLGTSQPGQPVDMMGFLVVPPGSVTPVPAQEESPEPPKPVRPARVTKRRSSHW